VLVRGNPASHEHLPEKENPMGSSTTITSIREIPLNKLVPSPLNVRQTSRGSGIDELAISILAHGLLQNLTVRPQLDDDNRETGRYEVIAGGRRLAALKLLASQKKIAKTAPISCVVREDGSARELSLVENVQRVNLHPADQFEAFRQLNEEEGLGAEEIGARFGVTARVVRERLKLAAVNPKLMAQYRAGALSLDQIMAFAVIDDKARQEEVWESLSHDKSPPFIRRRLLQGHVSAQDRLAVFVGVEAYEAAGGAVLRDLFAADNGGYLSDVGLLDRLARAKLETATEALRAEGWKWIDVAVDFPHAHGLRRVYPHDVELSEADISRLEAIEAELDQLAAECEALDEPDTEMEARINALSDEYEAIDAKGRVFEPADIARAGAIVSVDQDGTLVIVRGMVRPEDEPKAEEVSAVPAGDAKDTTDDDDVGKPSGLSDRLIGDLSAQRTMAMRDQLAVFPEMAHVAITHAFTLQLFYYGRRNESCLNLLASSIALDGRATDIGDGIAAKNVGARHEAWAARMPTEAESLWAFVLALGFSERQALLAHCVALLIDGAARDGMGRSAAADVLAEAINLDMRAYWRPTVGSYLSRVPKALILEAVREGVSADASERLRSLKKDDMAQAAEEMLVPTPWLPAMLRSQSATQAVSEQSAAAE
jgi:ParB family transcriptional regulator, chromosome partitioning protein